MKSSFTYETNNGCCKGNFNIYQGRNGKIYLLMGESYTQLTNSQIEDLNIDVYSLPDFNYDSYISGYNLQ